MDVKINTLIAIRDYFDAQDILTPEEQSLLDVVEIALQKPKVNINRIENNHLEIFFDDLNDEAKALVLKFYEADDEDDLNMTDNPLFVLEYQKEI